MWIYFKYVTTPDLRDKISRWSPSVSMRNNPQLPFSSELKQKRTVRCTFRKYLSNMLTLLRLSHYSVTRYLEDICCPLLVDLVLIIFVLGLREYEHLQSVYNYNTVLLGIKKSHSDSKHQIFFIVKHVHKNKTQCLTSNIYWTQFMACLFSLPSVSALRCTHISVFKTNKLKDK